MHHKAVVIRNHIVQYKNVYSLLFKILVAAGTAVYIIYKIEPAKIVAALRNADLLLLGSAVLLLGLNIYMQYLKWALVCKHILNIHERQAVITSLFYGFSGGMFTPARTGEYAARCFVLSERSVLQVSAGTFIDKMFPFFIVLIAGIAASIPFVGELHINAETIYILLFLLLILSLPVIIYRNKLKEYLYEKFLVRNKEFFQSIKNPGKDFIIKISVVSTVFYLCYIFQYALLLAAFSSSFNLKNGVLAGVLVMFYKTVFSFLTVGELGIRESASVYFVTQMGGSPAAAFNAAFFLFIINILLPSLAGILLFTGKNGK